MGLKQREGDRLRQRSGITDSIEEDDQAALFPRGWNKRDEGSKHENDGNKTRKMGAGLVVFPDLTSCSWRADSRLRLLEI